MPQRRTAAAHKTVAQSKRTATQPWSVERSAGAAQPWSIECSAGADGIVEAQSFTTKPLGWIVVRDATTSSAAKQTNKAGQR